MNRIEIFTKTRKIIKGKDGEGIESEWTLHPIGLIIIILVIFTLLLFFI